MCTLMNNNDYWISDFKERLLIWGKSLIVWGIEENHETLIDDAPL